MSYHSRRRHYLEAKERNQKARRESRIEYADGLIKAHSAAHVEAYGNDGPKVEYNALRGKYIIGKARNLTEAAIRERIAFMRAKAHEKELNYADDE